MELFPSSKVFLEVTIGSFHLTITWYALLILTGAIIAYEISCMYAKKKGYKQDLLEDYFFTMLPVGIIGARLYYCIFSWSYYAYDPIRIFYIWEGGLAIHGGLIAGILYSLWFFHHRGVNFLRIMDCIMPNVLIAQVIGRWGNFMNQEAFGSVVDESYFKYFPAFIKNRMYIHGAYRMPMYLYEGMANFIGFLFITFIFRKHFYKKRGDMIYAYITWYGMVRFFIEIFRTDALLFHGIKVAQCMSILFILIGVLGYIGIWDKIFHDAYPFKHDKPAILFDLDGTLVDSKPLIMDSFKHVFEVYKPDYALSEEELNAFFGPTLKESFSKYFKEDEIEKVFNSYQEYNIENHDRIQSMPHAKELLAYLKDNNYSMAIVSNKTKSVVYKSLEAAHLNNCFDVIVGYGDFKNAKPNPESLLLALDTLVAPVDNVIYVGDAKNDILAAKNISAYSIGYIYANNEEIMEECKPTKVIHDLNEMISLLQEDREWDEIQM